MKKNIVFAAVIVLIVALLYVLSMDEFVPIPYDKKHISITSEKECLDCHGKNNENPLSQEHPPKDQCFICHERDIKSEK